MPVCQKCQSPYDEWQHYCLTCGQYLKDEPPFSHRCPQCGILVPQEHTYSHKCAVPLKDDSSSPSRLISRWKWMTGGLIATLLILGTILALYLIAWPRRVPAPMAESPAAPLAVAENRTVSGEVKANETSPAVDSLQAEVEEILNRIKEANLQKNILLYMGTLSALYPQIDKKRQEISKTYEKFDFKQMAFTVNKLQEIDSDTAIAEVKWSSIAQNLTTRDMRSDDFYYRIRLAKELGQWKIIKIEELQH
jgi:predicted RNA-binding Zn-ribbon protein involved in translation (DUF1610 family)